MKKNASRLVAREDLISAWSSRGSSLRGSSATVSPPPVAPATTGGTAPRTSSGPPLGLGLANRICPTSRAEERSAREKAAMAPVALVVARCRRRAPPLFLSSQEWRSITLSQNQVGKK